MAILLAILFIGITIVSRRLPGPAETAGGPSVVAARRGGRVRHRDRCCSSAFAAATALILFLAANTSFNAFPRLAAILAEDGYMPRQFSFRGDRLAYSWGIVVLAAVAFGLLWVFGGDTTPSSRCTRSACSSASRSSQIGMVRHWRRRPGAGLALARGGQRASARS